MSASETAKTEETTVPEETITPPVRPRRRTSWPLGVAVVVSLLGIVIAASLWSARPHWRTYVFPADPSTGIAVAVDYPDTLETFDIIPRERHIDTFRDSMLIRLRPKPPIGLARWWFEKVVRQDVKPSLWEDVQIRVMSHEAAQDMDTIEKKLRTNALVTLHHLEHKRYPLGPALEITATENLSRFPGRARVANFPTSLTESGTWIYPAALARSGKLAILVGCTSPRLVPAYREIVPRVRLVKK